MSVPAIARRQAAGGGGGGGGSGGGGGGGDGDLPKIADRGYSDSSETGRARALFAFDSFLAYARENS